MQNNSVQPSCSSKSHVSDALLASISAITGLCFVVGVPGNIAALVTLVQRLKESCFTIRLMLSLAVSDLLTLLLMPFWIFTYLGCWIFGSAACKIISYTEYWFTICSAMCVSLISFQRYMQVLHPQKWAKLGTRGENGLLCGIWILSGVLSSYAPVQYKEKRYLNGCHCDQTVSVGTLLLEILVIVMCFFLLALSYCLLYRGVHQSPFFSSNRMTKLVIRIIVAFFILYGLLPISNALRIVSVFLKNDNLRKNSAICGDIARGLTFLNSCVDPFLYTFALRTLHPNSHLNENT